WKSTNAKTGQNHIRLSIFVDSMTYYGSTSVRFLAAKSPELLTYKVKQTYNHDPKAYTQGLIFEDGFLYESTGQHGESTLRKVDYKTGKVLQMYDLATSDFGEGIARVGDKIYMLTWESKKGYVFDLKTFNVELEFPLTSDGWGLTYDGQYLIRSDGSNTLYFIDPEYLTEVKTLEVHDHKAQVSRLNELEYYDGKIWANVYGEDYIVTIDPKTGAVIEKIDFSNLLTNEERRKYRVDVLNGIAWSNDTHQLFVTGKLWPTLFEVELIKQN
ncbi:MAG: glutaminyl-peptide cyclotransferase, partial [Salinivirgaceae bacterium]|nr:glutaminyl-peptide cyclotransferase [Salinivirgaceae bacterium]